MPLDSFMRPSSSIKYGKGADQEPPPPPPGPSLPPQLRQLLALLTEFGGKLGTAAVVIAWFTHIDPFGDLHWDAAQVQFGLATFLPLMLFDAALMLPDYSISDLDEQRQVTGMFVGQPELLSGSTPPPPSSSSGEAAGAAGSEDSTANSSTSSSSDGASSSRDKTAAADAEARRMADIIEKAAAGASPDAPLVIMQKQPQQAAADSSSSSKGSLNPLLRLRVSMGLLQQVYTRANPGIGLSPAAELLVVLVATLADEMLYRAVALTLLGLWLRDRLFEAGFDDDVSVSWLGQAVQMPTSEYSQYLAVAVVAGLGVAGFTLGALREVQKLQKMQVVDREGNADSPAAQALKSQLVSNLGAQNVSLYAVEGLREVTASVMAGIAYVTTHNLAAPMAGSVVVQTLFSLYQRISLERVKTKRAAMKEKVMARQQKLEAAMKAALAAKKAEDAKAAAAAAEAAAKAEAAAASSELEPGQQQQEEEEVDFLTAVLRAAEEQQQQAKQQQQRAAAAAAAASSSSLPDSTPANWHAGSSSSPEAAVSSGVGSSNGSSDNGTGAAKPPAAAAAAAAAADPEVAQQQLATLLEDMLRSPEGNRVVQAWLSRQDSATRDSYASSSPQEAIDKLLADPVTKAALLGELQEQLVGMSEAATKRQQQLEKTWRQKL